MTADTFEKNSRSHAGIPNTQLSTLQAFNKNRRHEAGSELHQVAQAILVETNPELKPKAY